MKTKTLKAIVLTLLVVYILSGIGYATVSPRIVEAANSAATTIGACQIFPDNNFWNASVAGLPVHPLSTAWINAIGLDEPFHMDFGSGTWNGGPIGIPYNVVSGSSVNFYNFDFYYPDESDPGPYPLPANPIIEWGSDHHILTIDTDDCKLYEIYDASKVSGRWHGGSGAIWDLNSNALRTNTWTSADAAGLPILPGLARYDEVAAGVIKHALRFTAECTADNYIWPARHKAPYGSCSNPVPFGARFRLKSNFDISGYSPQAQVLLQAFKKYGIVLADNGANWYVSGAPSPGWNNDVLHELDNLTGSNFEAVDTRAFMVSANSGATTYPTLNLTSQGSNDGWVLESTETSNVGGKLDAAAATINLGDGGNLGDDASQKQYRGILSFNTGPSLPDNAVITKVTLKVKKQGIVGGGDPVTMFQGFMVDIKKGTLGTAALQTSDFQTAADKTYGPFMTALSRGWYSINLTSGKGYINKLSTLSGLTQIRLRFKLDDNNDGAANYLGLYSGNAPAASRPQLVIQYYVP